jgi:large subunit ribosomal protein L19
MSSIVQNFEKAEVARLSEGKSIPDFRAGDTLKVGVKIVEGDTERLQYFEGLCIAKSNNALSSSFTVRKISNGEGVERKFPLYSPRVDSITLIRKGIVKRAKLYYMRELRGKASRIKEKMDLNFKKKVAQPAVKAAPAKASSAPQEDN